MISPDVAELLVHASVHSPFWRERIQGRPFTEIPVLKKGELPAIQQQKPPFGGMLTVPEHEAARIFLSPGPIYDIQGTDGDFWRFGEALAVAGFGPEDIVQNTFSYHLSPAGMMFDAALRKLGATVIPAGIGNTELQVQVLRDCQVTGYVGTPSFLATLLERAAQEGYRMGQGLKLQKAFFTAEKLSAALRREWEETGLTIYEGYGTADAGLIAYEDGAHTGLKVSSSVYLEICDPGSGRPLQEGEIGEVVVTVFDKIYPLIRFGTGDLSNWLPKQEGRYISGVLGRVGDGVKVKGMFVHKKQFATVLENAGWVSYYQAVVTRDGNTDRLAIYLESQSYESAGLAEPSLQALQETLRERIRVRPELEIVPLGTLPRNELQFVDKRRWD